MMKRLAYFPKLSACLRKTAAGRMASVILFSAIMIAGCTSENSNLAGPDFPAETVSSERVTSVLKPENIAGKKGGVRPEGLHPNSKRYADSSMPSASGRDGEVTVTARALRAGDGTVTLEVTTGELDSEATPPGNLSKLLVKALDIENPDPDEPIWEENHNKLKGGGYWSTTYSDIARGQQLFVHANVRGIIRGTAVVKLTETVKSRPDLAVVEIDAPSESLVGDPVIVLATIAEMQQDVGATADCVFYVDGEEIDRADGIWVNAGDAVNCQFPATFGTAGTKELKVAVENVVPGDFDSSNNALTALIEVRERGNDFYWSASASIDLEPFYYSSNYYYGYYYYAGWGVRREGQASGSRPGTVGGFPMDLSFSLTSGGNDWVNETFTGQQATYSEWYDACFYQYLPDNGFLQVCDSPYYNRTHAQVQRYSAQATYYSAYYYWYGSYSYRNDVLPEYGTDLTFEIKVDGQTDSALMEGSIDLHQTSNYYNYCDWWGCYYGQYYGNYPSYLTGWGSGSPQ